MRDFLRMYDGKWIDGFLLEIWDIDSDKITYSFPYNGDKMHTARFNPCKWAQCLHGNAPSGTYYGNYRITLPNGKRVLLKEYI